MCFACVFNMRLQKQLKTCHDQTAGPQTCYLRVYLNNTRMTICGSSVRCSVISDHLVTPDC